MLFTLYTNMAKVHSAASEVDVCVAICVIGLIHRPKLLWLHRVGVDPAFATPTYVRC